MHTFEDALNIVNIDIILTVFIIALYFISIRMTKKIITKYGTHRNMPRVQRLKLARLSRLFLAIFAALILTLIWGLNMKDIWVVSSVIFGFIGVAIFAVWSLLSNVLAAYILFFSEPFQVGDTVTFLDGDNSVKGEILNMTTFYVKIRQEDGSIANLPNSLTFQKIVVKYPIKL